MRLLLINPNTTETITDLVARHAGEAAGPGVEIRAVTGRFGPRYISSRAAAAVAGHAALDALAEHGAGVDAVLLACFGDPGLGALREMASVPVVGMAEAACHLACLHGARFGIVTGGERWGPMLREFVDGLGLGSRLAGIRTIAPTGAEIARDPEAGIAALAEGASLCVREDGADVVILGGAGLAGLADRVGAASSVPVLCSVRAGIAATIAAARLGAGKAQAGAYAATPAVETVGLSPALGRAFGAT